MQGAGQRLPPTISSSGIPASAASRRLHSLALYRFNALIVKLPCSLQVSQLCTEAEKHTGASRQALRDACKRLSSYR